MLFLFLLFTVRFWNCFWLLHISTNNERLKCSKCKTKPMSINTYKLSTFISYNGVLLFLFCFQFSFHFDEIKSYDKHSKTKSWCSILNTTCGWSVINTNYGWSVAIIFCVVLLCVFTIWVPCCDVCYDFRIKPMFDSSLPPVVCRRVYVLFTCYLCLFADSDVLFVFVLCILCYQFLQIVHFWLPLR